MRMIDEDPVPEGYHVAMTKHGPEISGYRNGVVWGELTGRDGPVPGKAETYKSAVRWCWAREQGLL